MNCKNCHELIEDSAAYCGNCGYPTNANHVATKNTSDSAPSYAVAKPYQHRNETKALLSLLFGVTGIVGGFFIAIIGLVLGMTGVVLGTLARSTPKKAVATAGIMVSSLAMVVGLGVWTYSYKHSSEVKAKAATPQQSVLASELSTPCYYVSLVDKFNISASADSCNMLAYNGQSLESSTSAYKIYASQSQITDSHQFTSLAKQALEKDVQKSLQGYDVVNERVSSFSGSPAYTIKAVNEADNIYVTETAVYHKVKTGSNIFLLVHATNGDSADLAILEGQWQWK